MEYNLLNISPFNENLLKSSLNKDFKISEDILEENNLFLNRLFKAPNKNIWEILSICIYNNKDYKNDIQKKFEESIDYLENNLKFENSENNLFNDRNIELKFEKICLIYEMKIILYNINFEKFNMISKIFGNIKNKKSVHILVYQNHFYSLIENKEIHKIYNDVIRNKNSNIDSSKSTLNDSKDLFSYYDNNQMFQDNNLCMVYSNKKEKLKNYNIPFNVNLMNLKGYIEILEKLYPKNRSNYFTQGIKKIEKSLNMKRNFGILKFFDKTKGFGFVVNEADNKDLFIHNDDLNKININFDIFKLFKKKFYLRFSYIIFEYVGKHNKSRKAININLEEIKLLNNKFTN